MVDMDLVVMIWWTRTCWSTPKAIVQRQGEGVYLMAVAHYRHWASRSPQWLPIVCDPGCPLPRSLLLLHSLAAKKRGQLAKIPVGQILLDILHINCKSMLCNLHTADTMVASDMLFTLLGTVIVKETIKGTKMEAEQHDGGA